MGNRSIYSDIAKRTGGNIYIGVVGPVRTGKSTFIKRFMETLVIPNISDTYLRERARDELPQSGSGRTIMTAEPKFIPEEAINISFDDNVSCSVRLVDCVGYMIDGAGGHMEDGEERMVATPWYDTEIPISIAAEEGTRKVITDHSTIGMLITTDGSICGISRENYIPAEEKTARELAAAGKPYLIVLNTAFPGSDEAKKLSCELSEKYSAVCVPINCLEMSESEISAIFKQLLMQFEISKICIKMPLWASALSWDNDVKSCIYSKLLESTDNLTVLADACSWSDSLEECEYIQSSKVEDVDFGTGEVCIELVMPQELYYETLSNESGLKIENDGDLVCLLRSLSSLKSNYERVAEALEEVKEKGYGIVMPLPEEMHLAEPEIVRQGTRYGVKLKASAPSIHMILTDVETEVSPAVGGEKANEEILNFLLQGFDGDAGKIWDSNIFGKSLHDIASEGLITKIRKMPEESQMKLKDTLERIINEGSNGLICIII